MSWESNGAIGGQLETVSASRDANISDSENLIVANSGSAIVITVNTDALAGWGRSEVLAIYQAGAGASTFTAGPGVTFRGTAPSAAQYSTVGLQRVGGNEWAYL